MSSCYIVDTHAHLDLSPLDKDVAGALERAAEAGVRQVMTIGIDLDSSAEAVRIASGHENVFAAVGVHPHDASKTGQETFDRLSDLVRSSGESVVAWGEIGLDYAKEYSPRDAQKDVFAAQLDLAQEHGLPVIIHARDANRDVLDILASGQWSGLSGVFHCFSGDTAIARQVLDLGFYISITGVVTFKNASATREVVGYVPQDRLLLETDAPFLSPVPFRGKPNEPARTAIVAEAVAEIRGVTAGEVACFTTRNAQDLFKLPSL